MQGRLASVDTRFCCFVVQIAHVAAQAQRVAVPCSVGGQARADPKTARISGVKACGMGHKPRQVGAALQRGRSLAAVDDGPAVGGPLHGVKGCLAPQRAESFRPAGAEIHHIPLSVLRLHQIAVAGFLQSTIGVVLVQNRVIRARLIGTIQCAAATHADLMGDACAPLGQDDIIPAVLFQQVWAFTGAFGVAVPQKAGRTSRGAGVGCQGQQTSTAVQHHVALAVVIHKKRRVNTVFFNDGGRIPRAFGRRGARHNLCARAGMVIVAAQSGRDVETPIIIRNIGCPVAVAALKAL